MEERSLALLSILVSGLHVPGSLSYSDQKWASCHEEQGLFLVME